MRYSKLLGKTLREAPSDAEAASHQLLVRAGYIDQLMSGVFSFLPLGWRVHQRIESIIREEMNAIGSQEIFLPTLQKKAQWQETGRWDSYEPPLFKFEDQHGRELALGPTHEEIITDLARRYVHSYRDLPLAVYQIQNKFRNELRPTGGLLRMREFVMKDLYSFHADEASLADFFEQVKEAYRRIFARVGVEAIAAVASGGSIGGERTLEFQVPSAVGEDRIVYCSDCHYGVNKEVGNEIDRICPKCRGQNFAELSTIEVGHIFSLGTEYSAKMKATFTNKDGTNKPVLMGCYGIGLGRLLATIVEVNHDKDGIIWPESVAPFKVHLLAIDDQQSTASDRAERLYRELVERGVEVLYDDREGVSAGEKFADADLIGCPYRVVVSQKTLERGGVELKKRRGEKAAIVSRGELLYRLGS
jgi:prolyl-tRNA synthetase